jgi:hypothetical protein
MQLSHQTQIAFYALLLDALIQERGLASQWRVAPVGGTYRCAFQQSSIHLSFECMPVDE